MSEKKFFVCEHCGNLVGVIKDSGVPIVCCGQPMKQLKANTVDASVEKHTPVVKVEGNKVTAEVGSAEHPMVSEHFIEWIYVDTNKGGQRKALKPEEKPVAEFVMAEGEKAEAVYAYCNLHGLWKTEL
ncbi:MAG: desulfoferrodoxin family protein [Anaerovoracaceae bacterium]